MKKTIWIILPVVIIAVVLVAFFASQQGTLSDKISKLESENTDLARQLTEADMAAKTAQELAETNRISMEVRVQEAETKAQEAVEALTVVTTERDTLQANAANAAEQLTVGIRQVQDALDALGGGNREDKESAVEKELEETKAALTAATEELAAVKNESERLSAQADQRLSELQEMLETVTAERDQLQAEAETAASQKEEILKLQDALSILSAERDEWQKTAADALVAKAGVVILDAEENTVAEFEDISAFKLNELSLAPGAYTIRVIVFNAAGTEAARYDMPFVSPAEETPDAVPEETLSAEATEQPKAENDSSESIIEAAEENTAE